MSWTRFYGLVLGLYLVINLLFAGAFLLCGEGALLGAPGHTTGGRALDAFFFSVQTLATIGYGRISPEGLAANTLVAVEALVGMMGFALATGLLFARFSRPTAQIVFSRQAVIAPYRNIEGFMFRIANERTNELFEVQATVIFSRLEGETDKRVRRFHTLTLERSKVMFFPLHWVIVHPMDESSPLFGATAEQLLDGEAEFLVLLTAIDETFSQAVHARSSYRAEEVVVGARFSDMFQRDEEGLTGIDLRRIHDLESVSLRGHTS
jgi:inward rectifier potassium channel